MECKLIDCVREHSCLYDVKSRHYRDNKMRQEAWEEIAKQMNSSANRVKADWMKLRNAFASALNRRKLKSGEATAKITPWKFEQEMAFLQPFMEMRSTFTNCSQTPDDMEEGNVLADVEIDEIQESQACNFIEREPSTLQNVFKCLTPNSAQDIVNILKENAKERRICYEEAATKPRDLDETEMFYLSMAHTVKKLPAIDQALIRMQLCRLVSEAEIRMLEGCTSVMRSNNSSGS